VRGGHGGPVCGAGPRGEPLRGSARTETARLCGGRRPLLHWKTRPGGPRDYRLAEDPLARGLAARWRERSGCSGGFIPPCAEGDGPRRWRHKAASTSTAPALRRHGALCFAEKTPESLAGQRGFPREVQIRADV